MSDFVDTPMSSMFVPSSPDKKGGPGVYDGDDCPALEGWKRTSSPNGVPEKTFDGSIQKPSGEDDQF